MINRGGPRLRRLVIGSLLAALLVPAAAAAAPAKTHVPKWSGHARVGAGYSVSCPTAQMCMTIGATSAAYKSTAIAWDGTKWSKYDRIPMYVAGGTTTSAVSCATPTFCVVVGEGGDGNAQGAVDMWNGKKWSGLKNIAAEGDPLNVVSCVSPKFCAAGDESGQVFMWNGGAWSSPITVDDSQFAGISCSSPKFCAAVDGYGRAYLYSKVLGWRQSPVIPDTKSLSSVSCVSAKFCVATGRAGDVSYASTWNGSAWSDMKLIDDFAVTSVSCATAKYCVAVDFSGYDLEYDGKKWTGVHRIAELLQTMSVSCSSPRFCAAAAASGSGMYWTPLPKPTITLTDDAKTAKPGHTLTFTVTVSGKGHAPTGTIDWSLKGPGSPTCPTSKLKNGKATCTVKDAAKGRYTATASYSGDEWWRPMVVIDHATVS